VRLVALYIGNEANATGIVFKKGRIQSSVACHSYLLVNKNMIHFISASNYSENNQKIHSAGNLFDGIEKGGIVSCHKNFRAKSFVSMAFSGNGPN
jgi:hypothetical protein